MNVVILAAGRGSRLSPLTDTTPKPLLDFNGEPVIIRLIRQIKNVRPDSKISVVVGYQKQLVRRAINQSFSDIEFVENDGYATDTNLASVYLALKSLTGPCVIFEADCVYTQDCMVTILAAELDTKSAWYTIGEFEEGGHGGVLKCAPGSSRVVEVDIVERYKSTHRGFRKLIGILRVGPEQFVQYCSLLEKFVSSVHKPYYHAPWIQNIDSLACIDIQLPAQAAYAFNTLTEYDNARACLAGEGKD